MFSDGYIQSSKRNQRRKVPKLQRFSITTWSRILAAFLIAVPVLVILGLICRDKLFNPIIGAGFKHGDKLLGGLPAPDLNKSCLSRNQAVSYRKPSPHKPSSYLVTKLQEYEKLHKRCGPYTKSYNRSIKELRSGKIDSSSECKYVVWVGCCGLGNRILSITSAFLYALLTNRILLIDEEPDMANLFCEPFQDSSWSLPVDFPLKEKFNFRQNYAHTYGHKLKKNIINASTKVLPSYLFLYLVNNYDHHDKLFFCDQDQAILGNIPWLIMKSNVYFLPSLFLMSSFEEELSKLFPDKETVFHHLGRYLFHPSDQIWKIITGYYGNYLAIAEERIGIQVRIFEKKALFQRVKEFIFGKETSPSEHVMMDQIFSCIDKEKLLPQVDMGKSIADAPSGKGISKAVLITSLNPSYFEKMKSFYSKHPTLNGEVIAVYQPSHEGQQRSMNNMHNQKAWAEINLLSMMDVLVTSAWSTFGYVAQGLAGEKPLILYKTEDGKIPDPVCGRGISMEPCYHAPPIYDCKADREVDTATIIPHLRHCEDIYWGIKLFNTT